MASTSPADPADAREHERDAWAEDDPVLARIADLVDAGMAPIGDARFSSLACEAFAYQRRRIPAVGRLARARGLADRALTHWTEIPMIPASAFAHLPLHSAPPREIFRSSGTTGDQRSEHHHPFPALYRRVIDVSFPHHCLPTFVPGAGPPMLALIPPRRQAPDSSLGFMVAHVLERFGGDESGYAFGTGGVRPDLATAWCRLRIAAGEPVLILATAFALVQWLEDLAERDRTWALPAGSVVFETGGFKGRVRAIERPELLALVERRLGVPPDRVVREYGMTELSSQLDRKSVV